MHTVNFFINCDALKCILTCSMLFTDVSSTIHSLRISITGSLSEREREIIMQTLIAYTDMKMLPISPHCS